MVPLSCRSTLNVCLVHFAITAPCTFLSTAVTAQVVLGQLRSVHQGPAESSSSPVIRDALNRPCLDVDAIARAHLVNKDMLDHVVSVKNNCARVIKVKICYYDGDRCKDFSIQGYQRIDTILGTMMKVGTFRYSLSQK